MSGSVQSNEISMVRGDSGRFTVRCAEPDGTERPFVEGDTVVFTLKRCRTGQEAVEKTLETKTAWFWSRSRQKLWNKGESSGHFLCVNEIFTDCDTDTLLYLCTPKGPTCHTGATSCFFREITV